MTKIEVSQPASEEPTKTGWEDMEPHAEKSEHAQTIFNKVMEQVPEGADPEEYAKSPEGYIALLNAVDGTIQEGTSEQDAIGIMAEITDDFLDRGGQLPSDLDEIIFAVDENDEATALFHQNYSETVQRMREQRIEKIAHEVPERMAEFQAQIKAANKPIESFSEERTNMPSYMLPGYLRTYRQIIEKSDGQISMEPLIDALNAQIIPELLPQYGEGQNPHENFNMLEMVAKYCPEALADRHEPGIEAAQFSIQMERDPNGFDTRRQLIADFIYDKDHTGEQVVDSEGHYTPDFQESVYRGVKPFFFTGEHGDYTDSLDKTHAEILGPERTEALRFVSQFASDKYNTGVAMMADAILRSENPEQTKRHFEALSQEENWKKMGCRLSLIALRELDINPDLEPSKAIAYAEEVYHDCSKLVRTVENDDTAYDMMQNIGAIADAYPTEVVKRRRDAGDTYIKFFEQIMAEKHVLTDEEKKALAENMMRINGATYHYDLPLDVCLGIQNELFDRGEFTTPVSAEQSQNFDRNLKIIGDIDPNKQLTKDCSWQIKNGLVKLGLFDKDLSTPAAQENIAHTIESCIGLTNGNVSELFTGFIIGDEHFTEKTIAPESITGIRSIIGRIQESNSLELRRLIEPLSKELISGSGKQETDTEITYNTASAERKLDDIEKVFLQNNLPTLAKNLLVFSTLHPADKFREQFINGREQVVSPTLQKASEHSPRNAYAIMLRDLVKSGVESGSRELSKYLQGLQTGQSIMDRIGSGEIDFDGLEPDEQTQVRNFVNNLAAGHNQTIAGRKEVAAMQAQGGVQGEEDIPEGANWLYHDMPITQETVARINRAMGTTEKHNASDRLVRQFGYFNGFESVADMLAAVENARTAADARNRETAKKPFIVHPGDLVKNVNGKYLDAMLENGTNCKEFLGASADSDGTPLDTDLTLVGAEDDIAHCKEIQTNPNGDYGFVWYVIRNSEERFITTRKDEEQPGGELQEPNLRDTRMELFRTGGMGASHYGIRTGIGTTNIDAIIIDTKQEFPDKTAFRIAKNGFYIPVYDLEGNLVFTPDDYDALRAKLSGNHEYQTGEYHKASAADFAADAERTQGIDVNVEENAKEVARKDAAVRQALAEKLAGTGLQFRDHIDDDLTPGFIEVSNTGSTGRGTNVPGDGDFDYIFRVDQSLIADPGRFATLSGQLLSAIVMDQNSESRSGRRPEDIRTKHVHVNGMEDEVDIDITFVPRTDKVTYATEDAIKDYLSNFEGEERVQVVKNIIAAKKLFKAHKCYKPRHAGGEDEETGEKLAQGGLGGVGTENWILQNGGSLTAAARSFLEAAGVLGQPDAKPVPLQTFVQRYPIWDLGANHMAEETGRYQHDNFSANNLDENGYRRIVGALQEFLGES